DTRRSPSMNQCPTNRSFGPRTTELRSPLLPLAAGVRVASLLAGRLVLKFTHPDVAVQRRAIVDLKPAHLDVAAQPCVPSQGQLVARGDRAFDRALERHVRTFEQRLDSRAIGDVDVAGHADLAFDASIGVHRPVVDESALEDIARTHRELLFAVALDFAVVGRSRAFCNRLLYVHANTPDK